MGTMTKEKLTNNNLFLIIIIKYLPCLNDVAKNE